MQVRRDLARERRHGGVGGVTVGAVAGHAGRGFSTACIEIGGQDDRRNEDSSDECEEERANDTGGRDAPPYDIS